MCFNMIFFFHLLVKSNKCRKSVSHEHFPHMKNAYDGMGDAVTPPHQL